MSQTFTFINKSGRLYGQTQVYAGAVFGFDITAEHAPVFTLDVDRKGVFVKDVFYGGASMIGVLRGAEQSRVDFSGLGVKSKGERLSFGYTWLFTYGKNTRYTWRTDRKSREVLFLEDGSTSRMSASFKRTSDDEKLEGRLTIGMMPDLPMLMLIMMTLKLGLVRLQASDAKVPFGITEPGAVEAELERLEAVRAAGADAGAGAGAGGELSESMDMSGAAGAERRSEATTAPPESSRSSSNVSVHSAGKSWFQRAFKTSKG